MDWRGFLSAIADCSQVELVGPLFGHPHHAAHPSIYIDGGARFRDSTSRFPTISVGDGDSSDVQLDEKLPEQKDYSDLAFVLREMPKKVAFISMLGFLGGRRDHEILNLGAVHEFLGGREHFSRVDLDGEVRAFTQGEFEFERHGLFSVIAFVETQIRISGEVEYPFVGGIPAVSSLGLSNRGSGRVKIESAHPCFVFFS